jgi:protein-tyrosine phosphatase
VVPGLFLAGAYPGDPDPAKHQEKIQAIVSDGLRVFVSLMKKNETNHQGEPFVSYQDLAKKCCPDAECMRFPIQDLTAPSADEMTTVLDAIDQSLSANRPVYLHCWGGVGRTGTVVACWLLRHGFAAHDNVFEVLAELRKQDRERGARKAPESKEQHNFVLAWPQETASIIEVDNPQVFTLHSLPKRPQ